MATESRYYYPGGEAEFGLYNFHAQEQVQRLADVLAGKDQRSGRIVQLFGSPGSGRHYLVRAAAYEAARMGTAVAVEDLSLDGYEPDAPLSAFLSHLRSKSSGERADRLTELAARTKLEIKVTPVSFLFTTLAVKAEFTVKEILQFFEAPSQTPGPATSDRERLRNTLARLTTGQRLVLHIRNAETADIGLRLRLIDECELNPNLILVFSYLPGAAAPGVSQREPLRMHVDAWTPTAMKQSIAERFAPNNLPDAFLDFVWNSGSAAHSRASLAQVLLRAVTGNWLTTNRQGLWNIERGWERNESLIEEFSRDLYEPVLDIRSNLERSGTDQKLQIFEAFLAAAALCDPMIPVKSLAGLGGVSNDAVDDFVEWLDELFRVEEPDGLMEDLGYKHPGFPESVLMYRFRNPVLPHVVLKRLANMEEPAARLLTLLRSVFRPDTRAVCTLFYRLARHARLDSEAERYASVLDWWTSVDEAEALKHGITESLRAREIPAGTVWKVITTSHDIWPAARRLALIEGYGEQPNGVPQDQRFDYLQVYAGILFDLGRFVDVIDLLEQAARAEMPHPEWESQLRLQSLRGLAELRLGNLVEAEGLLEPAFRTAQSHYVPDHPSTLIMLHNLGHVAFLRKDYSKAREVLSLVLAGRLRVLGEEHPETLMCMNDLILVMLRQGDHAASRDLAQQVMNATSRRLGIDHPSTLASMNNLAEILQEEGDLETARRMFEDLAVINRRLLGEEHPSTLSALNSLSLNLFRQGRLAEARELAEQILQSWRRMLPDEHPDTQGAMHNLAEIVRAQADVAAADELQNEMQNAQQPPPRE